MATQSQNTGGDKITYINGRQYERSYDIQVYRDLANEIHDGFVMDSEYGYTWTCVEEYEDDDHEAAAKLVVTYKAHPEADASDYVDVLEYLVREYPIAFVGVTQVYNQGLTQELSFIYTGEQ